MLYHNFSVSVACKMGLIESLLLRHIAYWVEENKNKNRNFFEGRYWTYNTLNTLESFFPYISKWQIRKALKHLETEQIIKKGNFNKTSYDRTTWYTLTQYGETLLEECTKQNECMESCTEHTQQTSDTDVFFGEISTHMEQKQNDDSILQKTQMEMSDTEFPNTESATPIPYKIQYKIPKQNTKKIQERETLSQNSFSEIVMYFNTHCTKLPQVKEMTPTRKRDIIEVLSKYTVQQLYEVFDKAQNSKFLTGENERNWKATFDWLLQPNNICKVLEGNYTDTSKQMANETNKNESNMKLGIVL